MVVNYKQIVRYKNQQNLDLPFNNAKFTSRRFQQLGGIICISWIECQRSVSTIGPQNEKEEESYEAMSGI